MLLRLRQLCSHPSLITEDGIAAAIEREGDAEKHEAAMREKAEKDRLALLEKAEKDQAAQTERVIALWGKEAFDRIKAKKLEARCRRTDDDEVCTQTLPFLRDTYLDSSNRLKVKNAAYASNL